MSRRKPAWLQQREADVAKAREQYYATRPHTTSTTVKVRPTDKAIYMSTNIIRAGTHALFEVSISKASRLYFGDYAALGLQAPSAVTDAVAPKPRGRFQPSKVLAREGVATPTAHVTAWNSRVIRYTPSTTGTAQANYSAPFSNGTTAPTPDALDTKATSIYNAIKTKLGNLDYAEFYWVPEIASFTV